MASQFVACTASSLVYQRSGTLQGIFVSSNTGGTMAIFDSNVSTVFSPTAIATFTPNTSVCWYPMPFQFLNGINVSISGTISYTVAID